MEKSAAGVKSPLDKPLGELTEDDLSQVTREDCRRFLKEKGMRRPSWNKSQAIQQVISLKALLETKPEDENDDDEVDEPGPSSSKFQKNYSDPEHKHPQQLQFTSAVSDPLPVSPHLSFLPPPQQQQNDENTEESPGDTRFPPAIVDISPRSKRFPFSEQSPSNSVSRESRPLGRYWVDGNPDVAAPVSRQMTVFYDGKVNVFDGVPADKALMLMRIAANRDFYNGPSLDASVDLNRQFQISKSNLFQSVIPPRTLPSSLQVAHNDGSGCRKASLQRYREKRKDRRTFNCRKNMSALYSASTDLCMNQKLKFQNSSAMQCQRETNSPPHPNPPRTPTRSNSIDNHTQKVRLFVDLNDDAISGKCASKYNYHLMLLLQMSRKFKYPIVIIRFFLIIALMKEVQLSRLLEVQRFSSIFLTSESDNGGMPASSSTVVTDTKILLLPI